MNTKLLTSVVSLFLIVGPSVQFLHADMDRGNLHVNVTSTTVPSDTVDVGKNVREAFKADPFFAPYAVDVKADHGVVTLSGTVDSDKVKADFESKAKGMVGVDKVVNNIVVKPVAPGMK